MSVIFSRNLTSLVVTNDGSKPVSPLTKIYSNVEFETHLNIGSPEMPFLFLRTVDKGLRKKRVEIFSGVTLLLRMKRRLFSDTGERGWGR
jgi:hypothetical protein